MKIHERIKCMGNNWIQRSYKHIGKYFDCASINEYYNSLKESGENIIHVHSMYSIFDSTQTPDEICEQKWTDICLVLKDTSECIRQSVQEVLRKQRKS